MLFGGSEPRLALYSSLISHFRHFQKRLKKQCKKSLQNSCFLMKNWYFWTPGSFDSAILVVFGRYRKSFFFLCRTMEVQKREKSILARPRDPRGTPGIHQGSTGGGISTHSLPQASTIYQRTGINRYKKPVF